MFILVRGNLGILKAEVVEFLVAVRFFMVLAPNPSGKFLVI